MNKISHGQFHEISGTNLKRFEMTTKLRAELYAWVSFIKKNSSLSLFRPSDSR